MDLFKVSQAIDVPKQTETEDASNPALICSRRRWRTVILRKKERTEVEVVEDREQPKVGTYYAFGNNRGATKRVSATKTTSLKS